jgi:tRNA(Ile)-lysidine synthase
MASLDLLPRARLAFGLSGGGDSVALALLLSSWAARPTALIVDHGLRKESSANAANVADWARSLGIEATILRWRGKKPAANVEDRARAARYSLMGDWCREHAVAHLLVAHTREDQAETFLLRLGRGSGIDGLAAMAPASRIPVPGYEDLRLLRPLLSFGREELRAHARASGAHWIEDPMNADVRFARTRVRALLPLLEEAGVPVTRIVQASVHAARARESLNAATDAFLDAHARFDEEGARLDGAALKAVPREVGFRALSAVLSRVSGQPYRPRFERLERLFAVLTSAQGLRAGCTLHGCRIAPSPKRFKDFGPGTLRVTVEPERRKHGHNVAASQRAYSEEEIQRSGHKSRF